MKIEKFDTLLVDDLGEVLPLAIAFVSRFCVEEGVEIITNTALGDETFSSFVEGISYNINYWRNVGDMNDCLVPEALTPMVDGISKRFFSVDMCNDSILKILNSDTGDDVKILSCIKQDFKEKFRERLFGA